jgi:hypothetical protein
MKSVEALWLVKFGDYETPTEARNGGVLVLETNRGFGGDSGYAYLGTYEVSGDKFESDVSISQFDPEVESVWGPGVTELDIHASLTREDDIMYGSMWPTATPEFRVSVFLVRFKDLP